MHIVRYFYYVEYAISRPGALQDQENAVGDYRNVLALGWSRPLPELFDEAGMAGLLALIESELGSLEALGS